MNQNLGRVLMPLSRAIAQEQAKVLQPFQLTSGEMPFYLALAREDGITQEALSARVRVDKSVTTRVIRSLEAKGFVRRERNEQDRRSNLIYLTGRGREMNQDVLAALTRYNEQLIRLLSPEEYGGLLASLLKIDAYLQQRREKSSPYI